MLLNSKVLFTKDFEPEACYIFVKMYYSKGQNAAEDMLTPNWDFLLVLIRNTDIEKQLTVSICRSMLFNSVAAQHLNTSQAPPVDPK